MPRPVCITYDSTCDLTPQLLERFQIRTIPLTIQSGERVFPDNGQYTSAELYAEYRRNGTLPKTAAVSPEDFKAFFAPILAEGYDIVHIDISSELSCTCQNAVLAAQELAEQGEIHVVDSRQLSTGGGLLALRGAKLRDGGMTAADIRRSVNSQLLTVFFLPLAGAALHMAFAFPMIRRMLLLFELHNTGLFIATALVSFAVLAVVYTLVYKATSNAYYRIVKDSV